MKQSFAISDELLSAYIDRQISEAELQRVETALAAEPALQQRLDALQATVRLLQHTPSLVAPRAFVLSENQVLAAGGRVKGTKKPSFWEQWLPRLMPAATAIIAVLFFFSLTMNPQSGPFLASQPKSALPPATTSHVKESPMVEDAGGEREAAETMGAVEMQMNEPAPKMVQPSAAIAEKSVADRGKAADATTRDKATMAAEETESQIANEMTTEELATAKTTPDESPVPTNAFHISWPTWFLGILLILFAFLTWRVTLKRPRRE